MGRQVNFICSSDDILKIFNFVHENNASFYQELYKEKKILHVPNLDNFPSPSGYWICFDEYFSKFISGNASVDIWNGEIVKFSNREYINGLFYCRIWADFGFWKDLKDPGSYTYKSKEFEKLYTVLARFIKKGATLDKRKSFWFMPDAYRICQESNVTLPNPTSPKLQLELPDKNK